MFINQKIKYSFIIPTLNEEKLIGDLLSSLKDYQKTSNYPFEIIISDGGSKDKTTEIARKYTNKVFIHSENCRQKISEGRNVGAQNADGEILIFINCDVRIENYDKFFEIIERKFINQNFIALTFAVKVFPEEEKLSDKIFLSFYNRYFHLLNYLGMGMGRGECQIVKKQDFIAIGGYDENKVAGEDFDLFMRLRRKGKILFYQKFKIFESPRRYRKFGHWRILLSWFINAIAVLLFNKSISKQWEEVR